MSKENKNEKPIGEDNANSNVAIGIDRISVSCFGSAKERKVLKNSISKEGESLALGTVSGVLAGVKPFNNKKTGDDSIKFVGSFGVVVEATGERFTSDTLYLPKKLEEKLQTQFISVNNEGEGEALEFEMKILMVKNLESVTEFTYSYNLKTNAKQIDPFNLSITK